MAFWRKKSETVAPSPDKPSAGFFSTDFTPRGFDPQTALARTFQKQAPKPVNASGVTMDDSGGNNLKMAATGYGYMPDAQLGWYASQGFIGYQYCAMVAQHWLINKACTMPADDAIRQGWDVTVNGEEIDPETLKRIRAADEAMKVDDNLVELIRMSRVFGIRIALFVVDSKDEKYYEKPFNPDGIKPGSYRGISQVDPYWMAPELDMDAASNPASIHFYEPTWWRIGGKRYHRSHLIVYIPNPVADVIKPSYLYGGMSVPQMIYERVYAAERTANEAPMLAMTKRLNVIHADISKVAANQAAFEQRLQTWVQYRDSYGVKILGTEETAEQFDTSLADLDEVIMTQHQLVAAAAGVPATKLLGTQPKGFNTTGEFESKSYHEMLESLQANGAMPLLKRHYLLLSRSMGLGIELEPVFKPLDSPTSKEVAEINKLKADTAAQLAAVGAIDGTDERQRLIADPESGYSGMVNEPPIYPIENEGEENGEAL